LKDVDKWEKRLAELNHLLSAKELDDEVDSSDFEPLGSEVSGEEGQE
jgi:hypothetical protein